MKKVLLSAFALSAAVFANAQGITSTFATDDFKSMTEVTGAGTSGIFFSKDSMNNAVPFDSTVKWTEAGTATTTKRTDGKIKQQKTRLGDGVLSYVISQPRAVYYPIVVSLGTGNSIDISNNKKVRFIVKGSPDSVLYLKIALVDIDGHRIDAIGPNFKSAGDWYKDEVAVKVGKPKSTGKTVTAPNAGNTNRFTITIPAADPTYREVVIDYAGMAYGQDYSVNPPKGDSTSFKWDKVAQLQITPLNGNDALAYAYQREKIENVALSFAAISIGGDYVTGVEEETTLASSKGLVVYPNPAKNKVSFNGVAENVTITDVLGNTVFTAASASEVNVSNFNKGVYSVQSSKGAARLVVE